MIRRILTAAAVVGGFSLVSAGAVFAQDDAKVKRGTELFTKQKCQICHSIAGKGNAKGPLDTVGSDLTAEQIREWLVNPTEMYAKQQPAKRTMKPSHPKLAAEDVDALVAYLQTLKKK